MGILVDIASLTELKSALMIIMNVLYWSKRRMKYRFDKIKTWNFRFVLSNSKMATNSFDKKRTLNKSKINIYLILGREGGPWSPMQRYQGSSGSYMPPNAPSTPPMGPFPGRPLTQRASPQARDKFLPTPKVQASDLQSSPPSKFYQLRIGYS